MTDSVRLALALVNRLATARAQGRAVAVPASPEAARLGILDVVEALGRPQRTTRVGESEAEAIRDVAGDLRRALAATVGGDPVTAARILNALLIRHRAVPSLHGAPGETPALHFHPEDADLVDAWAGSAAAGLAVAIGLGHAHRFGVCEASDCDQVFFDSTRNASRRFCGLACQNRAKAAAYRARLGSADARRSDASKSTHGKE